MLLYVCVYHKNILFVQLKKTFGTNAEYTRYIQLAYLLSRCAFKKKKKLGIRVRYINPLITINEIVVKII